MKKSIIIISAIILTTFFTGCASKEKPPRVRDETFIADISPFEAGTFHLYASFGLTKPKICDFTATFYPRSNMIYVKGRVGMDIVQIGFSMSERNSLAAAKDQYIELYTSGGIKNEKPTKKNAISTGIVPFNWGALGAGYQADVKYYTNVEYILENKPYFRIQFEATKGKGADENFSSPRTNIYISPAQWEQIVEACSQERLVAMTDEILAEAQAF